MFREDTSLEGVMCAQEKCSSNSRGQATNRQSAGSVRLILSSSVGGRLGSGLNCPSGSPSCSDVGRRQSNPSGATKRLPPKGIATSRAHAICVVQLLEATLPYLHDADRNERVVLHASWNRRLDVGAWAGDIR